MDDHEIITQIGSLADEEKHLEERHVGEGISAEEEARLRTIEVTLDRLWDLLRQRRALRDAGRSPDGAADPARGDRRGLPPVVGGPMAGDRRGRCRSGRPTWAWMSDATGRAMWMWVKSMLPPSRGWRRPRWWRPAGVRCGRWACR